MTNEDILRDIVSLPPEGQRLVADFVAFLHQRYGTLTSLEKDEPTDLLEEAFIGMWQDRDDMLDSTSWVRQSRESEWKK
jgi:hypothetical protein